MCQYNTKVRKIKFILIHTYAHRVQKKATTHKLYSNEQEKQKTTRKAGICRTFL